MGFSSILRHFHLRNIHDHFFVQELSRAQTPRALRAVAIRTYALLTTLTYIELEHAQWSLLAAHA